MGAAKHRTVPGRPLLQRIERGRQSPSLESSEDCGNAAIPRVDLPLDVGSGAWPREAHAHQERNGHYGEEDEGTPQPAAAAAGRGHPNVPDMNVPATSPTTRNSTIAAMITTPVYPTAFSCGVFIRIGTPR